LWRRLRNPVAATRAEYAIARLSGARHDAERAKRTLERLGVRVESAAQAAGLLMALGPEAEAPLRVQTLGRFRVLRDGEPAATSDWQSKKARDLLKIMLSRRGRATPRDVLMDALWPGDDASPVGKRLSVALSTIRAVLDPEGRFPSDHFVAGDAEAVAVDLTHIEVDVEVFLSDVSGGLAALREGRAAEALELLESAEAAYTGDYLEEDLYEDWAAPLREEARAGYVAAARALALSAAKRGDHESAVRYRLRLVQRDAHDEEAHLGLVSALIKSGRHGDARRAYRAYGARMEEIGVEPAPFTPAGP
jgi:DNA-binding SARP family transcriptional activator